MECYASSIHQSPNISEFELKDFSLLAIIRDETGSNFIAVSHFSLSDVLLQTDGQCIRIRIVIIRHIK